MKILAIESSSLVASAAILEDDKITAEYTVNDQMTHSQTLLPMIDAICSMTGSDPKDFDAIAVAGGPGSFTGLRIGSATAKGLGEALGIPLIAVPTLAGMAMNAYGVSDLVCPIMDARRNQTYTGIYRYREGELITVADQDALSIEELIDRLNAMKEKVLFIGDGIPVFRTVLDEKLLVAHDYAPAGLNRQRAASIAVLGARMFARGETISAAEHVPDYLRVSQAERERMERDNKK